MERTVPVTNGFSVDVPSISAEVPTRCIHSHVPILHADDDAAALKLLLALIRRLDGRTVARFTE